jgi:ESS family glutamate:Na+ symporter
MLQLDPIQTLALAGVMLAVGTWLGNRVGVFRRYNIPAPIIGGLIIAGAQTIAHTQDVTLFQFATKLKLPEPWTGDFALNEPFMQMFFASLGCGASIGLLRVGGPQVLRFFGLAVLLAIMQNVVGMAVAWMTGEPPLFGVLCGSVTLTGGPATGLAFEQQFTDKGLANVKEIALASGMGGIICGGIFGGPLGTWLEARRRRTSITKVTASATTRDESNPYSTPAVPEGTMQDIVEEELDAAQPPLAHNPNDDWSADGLLRALVILLLAMGVGSWLSPWISRAAAWALQDDKLTLPSFIGAMFFAAVLRNLDDLTGCLKMSQRLIDDFGNLALGLFIVLTIMDLKLWQLAGAALPLLAILAAQIVLLLVACVVLVTPVMGRDYEAVVMSGGFFGFMMGTTANAMANMRVLVDRYGPAPRAFLVVPIVGAFLIDFSNGILITVCLNLFK